MYHFQVFILQLCVFLVQHDYLLVFISMFTKNTVVFTKREDQSPKWANHLNSHHEIVLSTVIAFTLPCIYKVYPEANSPSHLFQVPTMGPALSRGSSVLSDGYSMLHAAYLHPAAHPYLHKAEPFFLTPGMWLTV
jgi:hypothetical protein